MTWATAGVAAWSVTARLATKWFMRRTTLRLWELLLAFLLAVRRPQLLHVSRKNTIKLICHGSERSATLNFRSP